MPAPSCPLRKLGGVIAAVAAVAVIGKLVILPLRRSFGKRRFLAAIAKQKKGIVYLYGFPIPRSGRGLSVPVLKVDTFLRLSNIPFEYVVGDYNDSPTGRVPFIVHDGKVLAESDIIIDYLRKVYGVAMDASLTPEQHATGHAVRRMMELHSYPCSTRTFVVDNFPAFQAMLKREIPMPSWMIYLATRGMRKSAINHLNMTGIGDLTTQECYDQHMKDVKAIADLLGSGTFLFGSKPTSYDCALFAYLYIVDFNDTAMGRTASPVHAFVRDNARLTNFLRSMEQLLGK